MQALLKISRGIDAVTEVAGRLCDWLVIITIAVGFYNVAARYLGRFVGLKLSSNSFIELQWYLFSLLFFLGFSYILKHDANVRVDFVYARLNTRSKAWVNLLGTVLFLIPFCLIGIWVTVNPVLQSWGLQPGGGWGPWEMSSDADGLPRAPIKTVIIVAFALLLLQAISQTIKYVAIVTGYREIAQALRDDREQLPIE